MEFVNIDKLSNFPNTVNRDVYVGSARGVLMLQKKLSDMDPPQEIVAIKPRHDLDLFEIITAGAKETGDTNVQ